MLEKVREIERKYLGIEAELAQPETYADIERCAALNKELTELKRLVMEMAEMAASCRARTTQAFTVLFRRMLAMLAMPWRPREGAPM